jgi:hypothetical protein
MNFDNKLECLFPDMLFQPSLKFVDKAMSLPYSETVPHCRVGFWPYPQTLDLAVKSCQEPTFQLITKISKLRTKKFHNIGP